MDKRPRRPDPMPDGSGALPKAQILRSPNGQFASRVAATAPEPGAPTPIETNSDAQIKPIRAASPAQLVARVTRAIERELAQIEDIVGSASMSPARRRSEGEKRARTLASLARTLAEVTRLRAAASEPKAKDDDDSVPRDLDEFRATLERRLAQLVERRESRADRGDESG